MRIHRAAASSCVLDFATADAASAALQQSIGPHLSCAPLDSAQSFRLATHYHSGDGVFISSLRLENVLYRRVLGAELAITFHLRGAGCSFSQGRRHFAIRGDEAFVARPFETAGYAIPDGRAKSVLLALPAIAARAEVLTGEAYSAAKFSSQMADGIDVHGPLGASLLRAIRNAMADAREFAEMPYPAAKERNDTLITLSAAALLSTHPAVAGPTKNCALTYLRCARDYIVAHCDEPIYLSQLAAQFSVPMRTFQENFRKTFGLSAREFIRQCRLERAYGLLRTGDPDLSVTHVAMTSGFRDLAEFSRAFRARYAETPSQTLRSARHFSRPAGAKPQRPRIPH